VAAYLNGRTGQQCAQRWRHKVNPSIRKEKWTADEDQKLGELYEAHGQKWAEIARHMEGRTDQQCMGRWRRHLDPSIKREAWLPSEDHVLRSLYATMGSAWSAISKRLDGRTAQQCRARWFQLQSQQREGERVAAAAAAATAKQPKSSSTSEASTRSSKARADKAGGDGETSTAPVRRGGAAVKPPKAGLTPLELPEEVWGEANPPRWPTPTAEDGALITTSRRVSPGGVPTGTTPPASLEGLVAGLWKPSPTGIDVLRQHGFVGGGGGKGWSTAQSTDPPCMACPLPSSPDGTLCGWKVTDIAALQLPLDSPTENVPPGLLSPEIFGELSVESPSLWGGPPPAAGKAPALTPRHGIDHAACLATPSSTSPLGTNNSSGTSDVSPSALLADPAEVSPASPPMPKRHRRVGFFAA